MRLIITLGLFILLFTVPSCKKDFLDKTPDEDLTVEQVFSNSTFTQQFLANIYWHLPQELRMVDNPGVDDPPANSFTGASDDMEMSYEGNFSNNMNAGTWNETTYTQDIWSHCYIAIRKANIFLENIDKLPPSELATAERINIWKGEALFLRALYHFLLIRVYGPVPVIDKTVSLDADFKTIRRQPVDQCVAFIAGECDKAAQLLPERITVQNEYGRPDKSAAMALKARALLYMASPLWNGNPDYAAFKDDAGVRLFPDYVASRWQDAATAAKAAIDMAESAGHALHRAAGNNPVASYQEVFYVNFNKEVLFTVNDPGYLNIDAYSEPRGMAGAAWPLQTPTQNLVDEYEMKNGERPILGYNADMTPVINPASGYRETGNTATATANYFAGTRNMYVDREPRFYASINFTGARYKDRKDGLNFCFGAADGRPIGGGNYSETGYLLKKLTHPSFVMSPKAGPPRTWVMFRLGEQYLNYAEALNEAQGPVADVYRYVNLVRDRAGLPGLPSGLSKDAMRERIRHERRIELAFETHRYFDVLRWKLGETVFSKPVYGLDVNTAGLTPTSDAFYKRTLVETRVFEKKHNLWPMQRREIDKNQHLVQNPGW